MPRGRAPFIEGVEHAKSTWGINFKYPHEVAKYENALEDKQLMTKSDRMTCRECNTFKSRDHIEKHEPHPTLEGM